MKTIRVAMPDEVYDRLKVAAKENGYVGIASMLLAKIGEPNQQTDAANVVAKAIKRASKKDKGETFLLKELVPGWQDLESGVKVRAGKIFFEQITEQGLDIRAFKKGSSGHQIYKKIK